MQFFVQPSVLNKSLLLLLLYFNSNLVKLQLPTVQVAVHLTMHVAVQIAVLLMHVAVSVAVHLMMHVAVPVAVHLMMHVAVPVAVHLTIRVMCAWWCAWWARCGCGVGAWWARGGRVVGAWWCAWWARGNVEFRRRVEGQRNGKLRQV